MNKVNPTGNPFLKKLIAIILSNLGNENFGVNDLAREVGMTSSALRRKLHTLTDKTLIQLIREVRLEKAMELLVQENVTASEVAYKVGFGSPSYFNKCFHEHFGFPPGEAKNGHHNGSNLDIGLTDEPGQTKTENNFPLKQKRKKRILAFSVFTLVLLVILSFVYLDTGLFKPDRSIVVLPFNPIVENEENLVLAEGITENIQNNLVQIEGLQVLPINPLIPKGDNTIDIVKIKELLNVKYILSGSVQRIGDRIEVIVRLVDKVSNKEKWSKTYEKNMSDIFDVQADIARQVARELHVVIGKKEMIDIKKVPTQNEEALSLYLQGRHYYHRRAGDGYRKGMEYFQKAIEADPDFVVAYTGLAECYLSRAWFNEIPKAEGIAKARELIEKALEMDPDNADAHAIRGEIYSSVEWEWEKGMKEFQLALEKNPNSAVVLYQYSWLLMTLKEYKKARIYAHRAYLLNPTNWRILGLNYQLSCRGGEYKKALEFLKKMDDLFQGNWAIYWRYYGFYFRTGEEQKAVDAFQKALSFFPEDQKYANIIQNVYRQSGMTGVLNLQIEYELDPECNDRVPLISVAKIYARLGNKNKALDYIEESFHVKKLGFQGSIGSPEFSILYDEPRFIAILDKMGLTEYYKKAGLLKEPVEQGQSGI